MADINGGFTFLPKDGLSGLFLLPPGGPYPAFPATILQVDADQTPQPVTLLNLVPSAGSEIVAGQAITFELEVVPTATLDSPGRVIIWVLYPSLNGNTEVVYDGSKFTSAFDGNGSTVDTLQSGNLLRRKFTVLRNGGWPAAPTLYVHANTNKGGQNP